MSEQKKAPRVASMRPVATSGGIYPGPEGTFVLRFNTVSGDVLISRELAGSILRGLLRETTTTLTEERPQ